MRSAVGRGIRLNFSMLCERQSWIVGAVRFQSNNTAAVLGAEIGFARRRSGFTTQQSQFFRNSNIRRIGRPSNRSVLYSELQWNHCPPHFDGKMNLRCRFERHLLILVWISKTLLGDILEGEHHLEQGMRCPRGCGTTSQRVSRQGNPVSVRFQRE